MAKTVKPTGSDATKLLKIQNSQAVVAGSASLQITAAGVLFFHSYGKCPN